MREGKRILTLAVVLMLTAFTNGFSQKKEWSLEDCINYALDNNIDIKKQLLAVNVNEADLLQSKLNLLPSLNAGATHGYNWGQTIDRYTNEFAATRVQSNNFYLGANMNLFTGLQQLNTIKQNKLDLMASQYDLDLLMDDISIAVAGFYLDILFNQELLAVAGEQLEVTKQQVNRMSKMVEAGTLAKGDLLNIQAQAATEELQVVEAENRLAISYLSLQQLIDLPVSGDFRIETPALKAIEAPQVVLTADDVFQTALNNRPEIKSAELRVQSAEKGISIARGYVSPVLNFQGNWATGYSGLASEPTSDYNLITAPIGYLQSNPNEVVVGEYKDYTYQDIPFWDQLDRNNNRVVGLSLQIPIFNGWQVRNAISKAKIMHEDARYNLQQNKLNLNKKIQQAYADAVAALKNYSASNVKVEAQSEAFKYAEQRFEVGLLNSVEYNETKKELTRAESDLLQAKYRYIYTTTVLDFYMGKPLTLTQ